MSVLRRAGCVAWLGLAAGCGGSAVRPMVISNDVAITFTPAPPDVPFDPHSARLVQATRQLTTALGHPVALQVDAALTTPLRSSLEDELADAVEHLSRDVTSLRKASPRAFAREGPRLARVSFRYSALVEHRLARLETASGTVIVEEPATGELLEDSVVAEVLEGDYETWLNATLSAESPDSVPPDAWEDYFEWAGRFHPAPAPADGHEPSAQEKFDNDPRGQSLVRITRFARIAGSGDGPLARKIDEHLVLEMYYLLLAYESDPAEVRRAAPGSLFRRAEAGWVDWLNWRMPALEDKAKVTIADRLFDVRSNADGAIPFAQRFPGFDGFAFALSVADAWARAGHPTHAADGDARFELMDQIVCPVMRRPDGTRDRNRGCAGRWVKLALADPAQTTRLASALGQRNDPLLVETLFANFKYDDAAPVVTLWRALAPYPSAWRTASQVVIEELLADVRKKSTLVTEAERVWAALPAGRGTALYLMARADADLDGYYADPRWASFDRRFGAPVSPGEFAAMLDASPIAIQVASVVWPALSKGWSRGEVLEGRLDRFLDDPIARTGAGEEPARTVRTILKRMCAEHAAADLARVHGVLVRRASRSAADAEALGPLVTDTDGRHCEKPKDDAPDR